MARVIAYHRPDSAAAALDLLNSPGEADRVLLGGGTEVNAQPGLDPIEVIDLQAAGLGGTSVDGSAAVIGATVTLQEVADDERMPSLIRDLARREMPSTLRTLATVGGLVAGADADSELLAALLAFGASATTLSAAGEATASVESLMSAASNGVITSITLPTGGAAAASRTGRTPGDIPIVAAVGHKGADGATRIAMTGVAATPVVVDDPASLDPPDDFRGSSSYRRSLAGVLAARVKGELG